MGVGLIDSRYYPPYTLLFVSLTPSCPSRLLEYPYGPSRCLHSLLGQSHIRSSSLSAAPWSREVRHQCPFSQKPCEARDSYMFPIMFHIMTHITCILWHTVINQKAFSLPQYLSTLPAWRRRGWDECVTYIGDGWETLPHRDLSLPSFGEEEYDDQVQNPYW